MAGQAGGSVAEIARERITELQLDLARWQRVLAAAGKQGGKQDAAPVRETAEPSVARVMDLVAERYGVTRADLLEPGRTQPATTARQVAMRLVREMTGKSYPEIGRAFRRDHTTVIHACEVTEGLALGDIREELAGHVA
jgi:chromosomal replication initiation ATPase DnaA